MAHTLITGQTMCGKTTLAKRLAKEFNDRGRLVLVLDPMLEDWSCAWQTDDPAIFMRVARVNRRAVLVVDEGGTTIGRYNKEMETLATQFRHLGHQCLFLVQRPVLIPVTIRANTSAAFVFSSAAVDADTLAKEYVCPEILAAPGLPAGQYIYKRRFADAIRGRVF